jgi:hypothetical protein
MGSGVDHSPQLVLRLKKEKSYTSTPPLGLHGLFQGELCFTAMLTKVQKIIYVGTYLVKKWRFLVHCMKQFGVTL